MDFAPVQVQSAVPGTMPRLSRCTFTRNSARHAGGALRIESVTGAMSVNASVFSNNWACAGGGGVSIVSASTVVIENSLILGNSAVARRCLQDSQDQWGLGVGGGIWHVQPPSSPDSIAGTTHACILKYLSLL